MFYFAFAGPKMYALYAAAVFASLVLLALLHRLLRRYTCSSCRAPMEAEWHDMKPGDRAHSGCFMQGHVPAGFSKDVTYTVDHDPFGYMRAYRQVHICHPCRRYFWGQIFKPVRVAGSVEGLIKYEEERSGKKATTGMQRLAKRMLRRDR